MSAGENELSLSEMRMLASSVVHMDVKQIALCVVTIPKLKAAIQDLLLLTPPTPVSTMQAKPISKPATLNGEQTSGSWSDMDIGDVATSLPADSPVIRQKPVNNHTSGSTEYTHKPRRINSQPAFPPATPVVDITEQHKSVPPVRIPLDAVLAESARGSTEFSMVGDKIAIGKPGKSKAKTEKRVRYITCRVCHLLFYKRDQYREHMRIHANDPNISVYSCDHCSFVTKRRGVFNTHVLRHTGDLPFKCKLCDYAGRQVSLLRQHMVNKHPDYEHDLNGDLSPVAHEMPAAHELPAVQEIKTEGSTCDVVYKSSDDIHERSTALLLPTDV